MLWCRLLKVLVTGGAGFIGSHTADRLLAEGFEVTVLDNLRSGSLENISHNVGKNGFQFIIGDIRDKQLVNDLVSHTDCIVHLAALVSVPESVQDPTLTHDINVNGTLNLLKASAHSNVERFVYASSCAVYGDADTLPLKEEYLAKPESPYGVSKLRAENYVLKYFKDFELKTVCLRYFNVYGPRQVCSDYSGVITKFLKSIEKNLPLTVFGDGEQTRDFVYIEDVVQANLLALKSEKAAGEVFNIGTGAATSINQLANMLLEIAGKKTLPIMHCKAREGDIRHSVADVSKAREKIGYNPKVPLSDGLRKLLKAL